MADPLDEFEFKPLTEGLGFHKKAEATSAAIRNSIPLSIQLSSEPSLAMSEQADTDFDLNSDLSSDFSAEFMNPEEMEVSKATASKAAAQSISDLIASLPPPLDFVSEKTETPQIYQPLAREEYKPAIPTGVLPTPGSKAASSKVEESAAVPAGSYEKTFPHYERRKEIRKSTEIGGLEPVAVNIGAAILDAMVITGISTILLVCILLITQVNLVGLLTNAQTDLPTQLHLGLLFLAVLHLYMLTARSFAGASLGEWAFDLQLGSDEDQRRSIYPLLAAWRMVLITATGLVLFPLLSLVFRRDVTRYLGGLQLYRRP